MTDNPAGLLMPMIVTAGVFALGCIGTYAIAPTPRPPAPRIAQTGGGATEGSVPLPLRKVSEKDYPAMVGALDPGADPHTSVDDAGRTVYKEGRAPRMTISWIEDGRPTRDDDGDIVGMRIEIPKTCIADARGWVGHALPVRETRWHVANGDVRALQDRKGVVARVCEGAGPDEAYDRTNLNDASR